MDILNRQIPELKHGGRVFYMATPAELAAHGVPAAVVLASVKPNFKLAIDELAEACALRSSRPAPVKRWSTRKRRRRRQPP